jgi:hypothetical protein
VIGVTVPVTDILFIRKLPVLEALYPHILKVIVPVVFTIGRFALALIVVRVDVLVLAAPLRILVPALLNPFKLYCTSAVMGPEEVAPPSKANAETDI